MTNSKSPNFTKATSGDYRIPIKLIFIETWQQLIKMPKAFWQGFGLVMLVLFATTFFMGFLLRWGDLGIIHFQNHQAQLPNLHTLHVLNKLKVLLGNFIIGIVEVLRTLLTVSFAYLALNQIRQQPIKATKMFAFLKNWQSLLLISVVFYLLEMAVRYGLFFFFRGIHLYPLLPQDLSKPILMLGYGVHFLLALFLYTYLTVVAFMASLLVLDQKLTFKKSVYVAFKSINRHALKNITLLFLAAWAYIGAWSDIANPLFNTHGGFGFYFYYLVLLPGLILAISFVLYKIIVFKNKPSQTKNIILMILRFMLGLFIVALLYSGVGLIWLLPVIAVLLAIQYQHIYLDNH